MRLLTIAVLAWSTVARADGVVSGVVKVTRPTGVEVGRVLVYLVGFDEKAPKAAVEMKQHGKRFDPDLAAVTVGGTVAFPNGDPFLHNVFSPTSDRTFDLGSYGRGEARNRTFPKRGVIDIYCNIHPEMSATLVILPNTRFVYADAAGKFRIDKVPPGKWTVFAFSRRAVRPVSAPVTVEAGTVEVELVLEETQRSFQHQNKYNQSYRPTTIYK